MIIYPAIDLREGRAVLLRQGDPAKERIISEDPTALARQWVDQGAEWLHIVDLDGAMDVPSPYFDALRQPSNILIQSPTTGETSSIQDRAVRHLPINLQRLHEIRKAVDVAIQFGGGLRTLDDIELAIKLGADRVILGTVAVENPKIVCQALRKWGSDRIVVGLDTRAEKAATHGWQETSDVDIVDLGHRMQAMGVTRVLFTDITRDGMLSGVNTQAAARLGDMTGLHVIASGGLAGLQDIEALKEYEHYNIDGVVTGQALYSGTLDLAQAIQIGHRPLARRSAGIVPYRMTENGPEFLLLFNLFFEQWEFPRGGLLPEESDLACAQREFYEETGLSLRHLYEECRAILNYTASIRNYEIARTIVYFLAEVADGPLHLGDEDHCEARWVNTQTAWELLTETSPEQLPAFDAAHAYLQQKEY